MDINADIQYLKGVGPRLAPRLHKLGVKRIIDILNFFPYRYEDRRRCQTANQLSDYLDKNILLKGTVVKVEMQNPRPRFYIVRAQLRCYSGQLFWAVWFNQQYVEKLLKKNAYPLFISGKVTHNDYKKSYEVNVEDYEIITPGREVEKIVPFYHLTEGLYQKKIREIIQQALTDYLPLLGDPYDVDLRIAQNLMTLRDAVKEMHQPGGRETWKSAHHRLVFDDFFYVQLAMALRSHRNSEAVPGISFNSAGELVKKFYEHLPYKLTVAQQRVIAEILADMAVPKPMNRMVQGDVGSGKTDLALVAMLCAVQNGYQAAFMAPTTVLAEQHYIKISSRLEGVPVRIRLVLGKHTVAQKKGIYKDLQEHKCDIVIGTHALIQENVKFAKLGLAVIDEQHRFGVIQRQILKSKGEENIDILLLTATPIPRTLALTFYGDLQKSIIDEMPPGRLEIKTYQAKPAEQNRLYEFCRQELRKDNQVYIVYPLIEESEKIDLQAAVESYEFISKNIFPEYKVGLLHGRLKEEEKEKVLADFRRKELKILVSTTVIEVGVDVPDATVMIIENAVRFGLSQLHQLRGRVGRSAKQAYCFLVAEAKSPESKKRLQTMVSTNDGFKIAEADLELRGPGDFLGVRQSGLPELRVADLIKDEKVLKEAKNCAFTLIAHDPLLHLDKHKPLKQELLKRTNTLVDYIFLN